MTKLHGHRRRNLMRVGEWAEREGVLPDTARDWIHRRLVDAVDLNAGTGKRPRWRIKASQHRPDR